MANQHTLTIPLSQATERQLLVHIASRMETHMADMTAALDRLAASLAKTPSSRSTPTPPSSNPQDRAPARRLRGGPRHGPPRAPTREPADATPKASRRAPNARAQGARTSPEATKYQGGETCQTHTSSPATANWAST